MWYCALLQVPLTHVFGKTLAPTMAPVQRAQHRILRHVEPVLPDHAILEEPATTLFRDTVKSLVEQLMPRVERDLGWAASTHWSSVRSSHTGDVEDFVQPLCFRDMCTQCTEDIDNHSSMCTGNTPPMQMCSTVEVEIRKQLARLQPVASMEGGTAVRPNSNLPG